MSSAVSAHVTRRVADARNTRYRAPNGGELSPRHRMEVAADAGEQLVSARPATAWHGTRNTVPSGAANKGALWLLNTAYSSNVRRPRAPNPAYVVVTNRGANSRRQRRSGSPHRGPPKTRIRVRRTQRVDDCLKIVPMRLRFSFLVGVSERHQVDFSFAQFWGYLTISVDGKRVIRDWRVLPPVSLIMGIPLHRGARSGMKY